MTSLNAGDPLYVIVGANQLTLSSNILDNGSPVALVKGGTGNLTLNTATGSNYDRRHDPQCRHAQYRCRLAARQCQRRNHRQWGQPTHRGHQRDSNCGHEDRDDQQWRHLDHQRQQPGLSLRTDRRQGRRNRGSCRDGGQPSPVPIHGQRLHRPDHHHRRDQPDPGVVPSVVDSTVPTAITLGGVSSNATGHVFGYNGTANVTFNNRSLNLTGTGTNPGAVIQVDGTGVLTFAGGFTSAAGVARTLTLAGTVTGTDTDLRGDQRFRCHQQGQPDQGRYHHLVPLQHRQHLHRDANHRPGHLKSRQPRRQRRRQQWQRGH